MTRAGQYQHYMSPMHGRALALGVMFVTALTGTPAAQAQTYTVLYDFKGSPTDGKEPGFGSLIRDSAGNLYGTTEEGGTGPCNLGCGAVFKLNTTGETVLYSFTGADGYEPYGGLIRDSAGNLYGTTRYGGASGLGVVFKLDTTGTETVLYSFTGGTDGSQPFAGLIQDPAGNLYGTTYFGGVGIGHGNLGYGVVFEVDSTGTETVLYSFKGGADGANPVGVLARNSAGDLYGTANGGGMYGVVFKLDTAGTETVLHSFTGADGKYPSGGLIKDPAGNLYGTTMYGGASNHGVVFKLDTTGVETVLYSFTGRAGGSNPQAGLILDSAGNLYGTTTYGGASGYGVVFKLDTTGTETVLHSFTGADGALPLAGLIQDAAGNLYGTDAGNGDGNMHPTLDGTVFKIQP